MIKEFQGDYRFLSNFYPAKVELAGVLYPSVEHAYQAAKSWDSEYRNKILNCRTPGDAKRLGRKAAMRGDWENIKYSLMSTLVHRKFSLHPDLKAKLLATGDQELQEGNMWHDTYWGVDLRTGKGDNNLGKILMLTRAKLKEDK